MEKKWWGGEEVGKGNEGEVSAGEVVWAGELVLAGELVFCFFV